jgi:hypothetical protein
MSNTRNFPGDEFNDSFPVAANAELGSDDSSSGNPDPAESHDDTASGEGARAAIFSAATEEARAFVLPDGWEEGRPILTGVYMDYDVARVHEDMICMLTYAEDGTPTVTVATNDLGFLAGMPAVLEATQHFAGVVPELARGPLNIQEGRDSPVIARSFTLDTDENRIIASEPFLAVARPTRLDVDEADRIMDYDSASPLHGLRDFADEVIRVQLASRRLTHNRPGLGYTQDETGVYVPVEVAGSNSASYINEILLGLFNEQMAEWAQEHEVPVIYRNRHFADGPTRAEMHRIMLEGTPGEQTELISRYSHTITLERTELGTIPTGNIQRDTNAVINMSSPLRESDGAINSANISAVLHGQVTPSQQKHFPVP